MSTKPLPGALALAKLIGPNPIGSSLSKNPLEGYKKRPLASLVRQLESNCCPYCGRSKMKWVENEAFGGDTPALVTVNKLFDITGNVGLELLMCENCGYFMPFIKKITDAKK